MNPYVSLLIMAAVALVVAIGGLALSAIVSPNRRNTVKVANYECGVDPTPSNVDHGRFPVKFYITAMMFLVFDVEIAFLYPWVVAFDQLSMFVVLAMIVFLLLLCIAYFYEYKRGGMEWD